MTSRQIAAVVGYCSFALTLTGWVVYSSSRSRPVSSVSYEHLPELPETRSSNPYISFDAYGFGHIRSPLGAVCFAPGTPLSYVEKVNAELFGPVDPDAPAPRFNLTGRWSAGVNGGTGLPGSPQTLRWSFVPDGTPNVTLSNGSNPVTSNLFATLDARFAGQGGRATWVSRFQMVFDRWQALTGLSYTRIIVATDADDGASLHTSPGQAGVRGDVRIAARSIDGASNVLAFNFFPDDGDMTIDSDDGTNFASAFNNNVFLRDTCMHEHGHGMGLLHVCPIGNTRLMEPFIDTGFDGPQHDDIRAAHTHYGDKFEQNDNPATATNLNSLGSLAFGVPLTVGVPPAPSIVNGSTLSLEASDNGTGDYFKFTTAQPVTLTTTASPIGTTYDSSQQACGGAGSCCSGNFINSLTMANLDIQVLAPNGVTILTTANSNPAGSPETVSNLQLIAAGTYFIRVFSAAALPSNNTQLYQLTVTLGNLDCNNNGIPDPQDVANHTSPDCDGNNVPDECQVPPICMTCLDCQSDGIPDSCQIPPICPTCPDCNGNLVPDDCEPDCNSNGQADSCDIAALLSPDCQSDGIPDECEVPPICTLPGCEDCNHNMIPDGCELASGALADCNTDGIPDRCQTDPPLCGGSCLPDCDGNFVPDLCQLVGTFSQQSPDLSPIDFTSPQSYTVTSPPAAASDVTLEFRAVADLGSLSENINMDINGTPIGTLFGGTFDCLLVIQSITLPAATFNGIVNGGNAVIHMNPSVAVSPACSPSQISVKVDYATASGDCNSNTILDACEIASGSQTDCNANGIPDSCDITNGFLTDGDSNNIPDECDCNLLSCRGDMDLDAVVNGNDVQVFITCLVEGNLANGCACADINGDLRLNSADVTALVARLVLDPNLNCH